MKILGIDPGYGRVGWGIVESQGGKSVYCTSGCIVTDKNDTREVRLAAISHELKSIIKRESPECAAVEKLFFGKNKTTALRVAESRGAILLALHDASLPIYEYTPPEVKHSITGNGRAEKRQVAWMVKNILKLNEKIAFDDTFDALALALMVRG